MGGASGAGAAPTVRARGLPLSSLRVIASVVVLAAVTLGGDLILPKAAAPAVLHIAVVFLGWWLARPRDIAVLAVLASGLVIAGHVLSVPELGLGPREALATRALALIAIWALAAVLIAGKRRERALRTRLAAAAARRRRLEAALAESEAKAARAAKPVAIPVSVSALGHDVRTPLNAIIGFSELVKQELFGPVGNIRYREYVRHINDSGRQLLSVFESHLEVVSSLAAGEAEPGARRTHGGEEDPASEDGPPPCRAGVGD